MERVESREVGSGLEDVRACGVMVEVERKSRVERERGVREAERMEDIKSGGKAEKAEEGGKRDVLRGGRDQSWRITEWRVLREESV